MADLVDALVEREQRAEAEQHQRDDERVEEPVGAVAERVLGVGLTRDRRPPTSSSTWLPESTTEWTPSASIDDEPVKANATNLLTAMPRLAPSAATMALRAALGTHGLQQDVRRRELGAPRRRRRGRRPRAARGRPTRSRRAPPARRSARAGCRPRPRACVTGIPRSTAQRRLRRRRGRAMSDGSWLSRSSTSRSRGSVVGSSGSSPRSRNRSSSGSVGRAPGRPDAEEAVEAAEHRVQRLGQDAGQRGHLGVAGELRRQPARGETADRRRAPDQRQRPGQLERRRSWPG